MSPASSSPRISLVPSLPLFPRIHMRLGCIGWNRPEENLIWLKQRETLALVSKHRTCFANELGADIVENRKRREVKVSEHLYFCDLESELSHGVSRVWPNVENGQVEPELPLRAQTVSYLVLCLWCCALGPGPSRGPVNGQMDRQIAQWCWWACWSTTRLPGPWGGSREGWASWYMSFLPLSHGKLSRNSW